MFFHLRHGVHAASLLLHSQLGKYLLLDVLLMALAVVAIGVLVLPLTAASTVVQDTTALLGALAAALDRCAPPLCTTAPWGGERTARARQLASAGGARPSLPQPRLTLCCAAAG